MGISKYFIAIVLDGEAFVQAEDLKADLHTRFSLKGALRSPAHITIHRPFEWKSEKEEMLIHRLQAFSFSRSFHLKLGGYGHFGDRVIFIAVSPDTDLLALHADFAGYAQRELGLVNESQDARGFHPHVTVAFRDLRKKNFAEVWSYVHTRPVELEQTVTSLSLLRHDGRQWSELRRFPFSAG